MFMQNEQRVTRFLSMEHERPAGRPGPRRHAQPRAGARWWQSDARFRNLNRRLRDPPPLKSSYGVASRAGAVMRLRTNRFKICGTNVGQRSTSTIRCDCSPCRRDLCGCGKRAGASASALEVGRSVATATSSVGEEIGVGNKKGAKRFWSLAPFRFNPVFR